MLAGPDPLVGLHMPVEHTQDEPLHNFSRYQGLLINDGEWLGKLLCQLPQYSWVDPIRPHRLIRWLKAPSNLTLNTSNDGASTTSLDNLSPCLTTLIVKKFLPYVQSKPTLFQFVTNAPCPVTTGPGKKSFSIFLISPLYILKGHNKVSPEPSLLQAGTTPTLSDFLQRRGVPAL
ncbi:hypothetical protein QYF61_005589 [Mycteria americana]|uniref:Uncharacterized protein n=1 Tax=Mycteria americana TaxID=33587 RepID=A0AAN7RT29_MYCAM|nr:hypothetical protein QYF61_005589 [Mycteria americana]